MKEKKFIYAVIENNGESPPFAESRTGGIDGAPLETICYRDLAAVVSSIDASRFDPDLSGVLQGESEMAAFNKTLGKFQLAGIPPALRGLMRFEVTFDIDANGIIHVHAKDLATDNEQEIRIEDGSRLAEDEVSRMMKDADAAHRLRELADARNHADTLAYQIERSLKEHRDKFEEADASTIEGRIMELRQVLNGTDVGEIRAHRGAHRGRAGPHQAVYRTRLPI